MRSDVTILLHLVPLKYWNEVNCFYVILYITDGFQNVKRRFNGLHIVVNNAGTANSDCDVGVDVNLVST